MGRVVRALALSALVIVLVGIQGVPLASADDHGDGPVGYTYGFSFTLLSDAVAAQGRGCNFYKVHLDTGVLTQLNPAGTSWPCADGLTFDEDGTLYAYRASTSVNSAIPASGASELVKVDKHDGHQTLVGPLPPVELGLGGMTFDAEGDLWLSGIPFNDPGCQPSGFVSCLWEVNPENAKSKFVGAAQGELAVTGLAGDCEDVLAVAVRGIHDSSVGGDPTTAAAPDVSTLLAEVSTSNGSLHTIADPIAVTSPSGLDFDDEGHLWAIGDAAGAGFASARVYRIDPDDGGAQSKVITLGGAPFRGFLAGLAVSPISCEDPEPPAPTPAPVVVQPSFTG
jgi:sugar lactone lactonase YvrE